MADEIDIVVRAVDNFSDVLGNFGNIMTGIKSTIDLVSGAFTAIKDAITPFIDAASESQVALDELDVVLKSTSGGAGLFSETVGKLSNTQLSDLYTQLDQAKNKLSAMKDEFGNTRTYTDEETVAIAAQKDKIAELTAEIQRGTNGLTIYRDTTQLSRDALIELSKALEQTTQYSDEQVMAAEAMMLRFENINSTIFPTAIKLATDLAQSLGVDLTSAARMVGMALDDPTAGVGRLNTQYRIFDASQMEVIKNMAASGDVAGAQALIIQGLTEKVGGAATAFGETFAGSIDIARNKLDDIRERIGGPFMLALEGLVQEFTKFANTDPTIQSVLSFFDTWQKYMEGGANFLGGLGLALSNLETAPMWLKDLGMAFLTINNALIDGAAPLDAIKKGLDDLMIAWSSDNPALTGIITYLQDFIATGESAGWTTAIQGLFTDIWNALDIPNKIQTLIGAIQNQLVLANWTAVGNTLGSILGNALKIAVGVTLAAMDSLINAVPPETWAALGNALLNALKQVLLGVWDSLMKDAELQKTLSDVGPSFLNTMTLNFTSDRLLVVLAAVEQNMKNAFINWFLNLSNSINSWIANNFHIDINASAFNFYGIGQSMIQGLINGWNSIFLDSPFLQSIDRMINSVKAWLGIASPSMVFFQIGLDIVYGLVNGILSLADWMISQIEAFVAALLAPFAPVLKLLGIDISGLTTTTTTGATGGQTGTQGTATGTIPLGGIGGVVNNFYGPVYFGDLSQLGYDCPSPNPLVAASQGTLLVQPSIG